MAGDLFKAAKKEIEFTKESFQNKVYDIKLNNAKRENRDMLINEMKTFVYQQGGLSWLQIKFSNNFNVKASCFEHYDDSNNKTTYVFAQHNFADIDNNEKNEAFFNDLAKVLNGRADIKKDEPYVDCSKVLVEVNIYSRERWKRVQREEWERKHPRIGSGPRQI